MGKCFSIILPTYNEAWNIPIVIERLSKSMRRAGMNYEIIVVDDNSPDGTAEIARKLSVEHPVKVYVRPGKLGLSSAIVYGAKKASCSYTIVMDCDLQHPPETVPRIARALLSGCDIVVASRYTNGGGVMGWSRFRLLESRFATWLAYIMLPDTRRTTDPMSGFFGCRREYLLDKRIRAIGYKILLEILHLNREARVCEVPYVFRSRVYGESKLDKNVVRDYIVQLITLAL